MEWGQKEMVNSELDHLTVFSRTVDRWWTVWLLATIVKIKLENEEFDWFPRWISSMAYSSPRNARPNISPS